MPCYDGAHQEKEKVCHLVRHGYDGVHDFGKCFKGVSFARRPHNAGEGKRLDEVHDSYAFVGFYKVIESQFSDGKAKCSSAA
jgi:hypothetical protein